MDILKNIDELLISWGIAPSLADMLDQFIAFALVLIVAFLADAICRNILLKVVAHLIRKTKATWDDIVFDRKVLIHLSRMVAPVIIYIFIPVAFAETSSSTLGFIQRVCLIYILITFLSFINSFLKAVYTVYSEKEQLRDRPLKGMLQTVQVILWFVGAIIVVSILIDKSPLSLLAGLGASAAILMLVFKDSIMGFVSGVQLSANDMLKVGDWIAMPKYGADGTVIEVTLNTVKVRNWDNTITTIPPYLLVSDSFQNWRGMRECGGRRIKRSVFIDARTIRRCTPEETARLREKGYLAADTSQEIVNLQALREYLANYLRNCPDVRSDLMLMVRTLQPTSEGVPLEFYCFTRHFEWIPYEAFQSALTDRVLTLLPEFGLQAFQRPAGTDLHERH